MQGKHRLIAEKSVSSVVVVFLRKSYALFFLVQVVFVFSMKKFLGINRVHFFWGGVGRVWKKNPPLLQEESKGSKWLGSGSRERGSWV